jgi:predicted Zn-dependent protease
MLSETGSRLSACVANKLRKFSFEAIKGTEANAFALPGGFIFVTRPLLELCGPNESEIAFIFAHEMAHVIRGHAINRIITNSAITVGSKAIKIRGPLTDWLQRAGAELLQSAYSRDMELEADTLGARLLAAAGYDPSGAVKLLSRLAKLSRARDQFKIGNYFSSHPAFDVRIQNVNRLLRK